VVQAALEDVSGTQQAVTTDDGVLVSDPTFTGDGSVLERKFTRDTLSPIAHIMGRLTAKMEFTTELRGSSNSRTQACFRTAR
jgi:hypothetical protein